MNKRDFLKIKKNFRDEIVGKVSERKSQKMKLTNIQSLKREKKKVVRNLLKGQFFFGNEVNQNLTGIACTVKEKNFFSRAIIFSFSGDPSILPSALVWRTDALS